MSSEEAITRGFALSHWPNGVIGSVLDLVGVHAGVATRQAAFASPSTAPSLNRLHVWYLHIRLLAPWQVVQSPSPPGATIQLTGYAPGRAEERQKISQVQPGSKVAAHWTVACF